MQMIEHECTTCRQHPGRCHICGGSKFLGQRQVPRSGIGHDLSGREFHALDAAGQPVYHPPEVALSRCPVCRASGRCYRCSGSGAIETPLFPEAAPGGPVRTLQHLLQDEPWQAFLDGYGRWLELRDIDTTAETRQTATRVLDDTSDEALEILQNLATGRSRHGLEFEYLLRAMSRDTGRARAIELLAGLEADAFVKLQLRVDRQGYFVAVLPADGKAHRLLQAILSNSAWQRFGETL